MKNEQEQVVFIGPAEHIKANKRTLPKVERFPRGLHSATNDCFPGLTLRRKVLEADLLPFEYLLDNLPIPDKKSAVQYRMTIDCALTRCPQCTEIASSPNAHCKGHVIGRTLGSAYI